MQVQEAQQEHKDGKPCSPCLDTHTCTLQERAAVQARQAQEVRAQQEQAAAEAKAALERSFEAKVGREKVAQEARAAQVCVWESRFKIICVVCDL